MFISEEIKNFLLKEAIKRFLRYVKIWTSSDDSSNSTPSTPNQLELGKLLVKELNELGLEKVEQDEFGYVYATLTPSKGFEYAQPIGFIAHLDTSPAVSGKDVKPVIHNNYDGNEIKFENDKDLILSVMDSPLLQDYIGLDIITSQGDTLLGADDKAGISEIMAACAAWKQFPELKHGEIIVCFNPDEEIGKGTLKLDLDKLPLVCYTLDGSEMGELEIECFDAWAATIKFTGLSVHPGYAKGLMINAIHIASRFVSEIPKSEAPETTEERQGFYHLTFLNGTAEEATAKLIIRDFDKEINARRMDYLTNLKDIYTEKYPGLKIEINYIHQYENMYTYLEKESKIVDLAKNAIEKVGLKVIFHPIRGGTDGSALSAKGIPTPNIFTGGLLFHSRKEHIPTLALQKAAEVIINLANLWTKENYN